MTVKKYMIYLKNGVVVSIEADKIRGHLTDLILEEEGQEVARFEQIEVIGWSLARSTIIIS